jgi:hypothetical protein
MVEDQRRSGKTSLPIRTIDDLKDRWPIAVIEGTNRPRAIPTASAPPAPRPFK